MRNWSQVLYSQGFNKFLIILDAFLWASSSLVIKDLVNTVPVMWLLAIRFIAAALLLVLLFRTTVIPYLTKETLKIGFLLGVYGFLGFMLQNVGLVYTTPGKNSFLTGLYVVMVPFIAWAWKMGKPERYNVIGAVVTVLGLGFIALDGSGFALNMGDILTIGCAVAFAFQIVEVARHRDSMHTIAATFVEFLVMGGFSLLTCLFMEKPLDLSIWTPASYLSMVYLAVVCSCFALLTTNHALSIVNPTSGSILESTEAPIAACLSVILGFEVLTGQLVLGFTFILAGILLSEAGPQIIGGLFKSKSK